MQRTVTVRDLDSLLEAATRASAHTALESVAAGFVTVRGGCRVGLCGTVSESEGRILTIRRLSSAVIRIPREVKGCAGGIYPALTDGGFRDALIISPPGAGKTTLLRELVRMLSSTYRVGLLDERGEVAGVWEGVPLFDVGPQTDVLTGADKRRGALDASAQHEPANSGHGRNNCPRRLGLPCGQPPDAAYVSWQRPTPLTGRTCSDASSTAKSSIAAYSSVWS